MIQYITETLVLSGVVYLIFYLILKRSKLFGFTRYFLISSVVLSLLTPILKFEVLLPKPVQQLNAVISLQALNSDKENTNVLEIHEVAPIEHSIFPTNVYLLLYLTVSGILLFLYLRNLYSILSSTRNSSTRRGKLSIVLLDKPISPFSFFHYLFLDRKKFESKEVSEYVFLHEEVHSSQFHSFDILLVELITCLFWFNPFMWFFKKSVKENHEYQVDQILTNNLGHPKDYMNAIIDAVTGINAPPIASSFSYIQIKNRIKMMGKIEPKRFNRITKIVASMLLLVTILVLNSFQNQAYEPFVVVLDAGHGGKDPGFHNHEILEKEISLSICRKISALSTRGEVEIILTRANDEFISLHDRVRMANNKECDLMLSIHSDGNPNSNVNSEVNAFHAKGEKSKKYAQMLLKDGIGKLKPKNEPRPANFKVLTDLSSPGVLLTLGNLNSKKDKSLLSNPDQQDKIAREIYKKLLELRNEKAKY